MPQFYLSNRRYKPHMTRKFQLPKCLLFFTLLSVSCAVKADIKLPQLISNGMVLQRNIKLKIWGWANPGEKVSLAFNGKKSNTVTDKSGQWLIALPAMEAGGPYTMTIKGLNQITLNNILIGDVYFCA